MAQKQIDDCFLHDKDRLTHEEALSILKSNINPVVETEQIILNDATNRVLAKDQLAPRPIPAHRNAAVDGYAFDHETYDSENGSNFLIEARITAGDTALSNVTSHQTGVNQDTLPPAARIFTGAVMPENFDTVVMQEDVTLEQLPDGKTAVTIPGGLKKGANCRQAGEDTQKDGLLVSKSTCLLSRQIASLASAGINQLEVYKKISVAIFSTGNEVIRPGETFSLGKVFDSNAPMLNALVNTQPCILNDLGVIKDNAQTIENTLKEAAKTYDVIITSGGASKGEEDHILNALDKLGKRHMWQLAIKPGRPMSFGQIGDTIFIGLPGNPVAAFVCMFLYGLPILQILGGQQWQPQQRFQVRAGFSIVNKKPDRREFLRGTLSTRDGITWVDKFKQDGSGLIRSLTTADGLIEIDEATTSLNEGDLVNFIPFAQPTF